MLAHEPRRHAGYARADACFSGIRTGGEECAMPVWIHSEWRLLHAHVSRGADSGPEGRAMPEQRDAERHQLLP